MAVNLPGPLAASRLRRFGAAITKIEPPSGDPLATASPALYRALSTGQQVVHLNLKQDDGRQRLDDLLHESDLLLTASAPSSLARLGLAWKDLCARYPRLCQVAIVGNPGAGAERPGHDLTYQASLGLLRPPELPRLLLADLAGAERAVSEALALLLARDRIGAGGYAEVSLTEAGAAFAVPFLHGLTAPGGLLGGGSPVYNLYPTREGWLAIACIEPQFQERLKRALGIDQLTHDELERAFGQRTAREWEAWAQAHDLPLTAVRETVDTLNLHR